MRLTEKELEAVIKAVEDYAWGFEDDEKLKTNWLKLANKLKDSETADV